MLRTTGPSQPDPDTVNSEATRIGPERSVGFHYARRRKPWGYLMVKDRDTEGDFTGTVELSIAAHTHASSVRHREEDSHEHNTVEHDNNIPYKSL